MCRSVCVGVGVGHQLELVNSLPTVGYQKCPGTPKFGGSHHDNGEGGIDIIQQRRVGIA
jgi:hypothetical protein